MDFDDIMESAEDVYIAANGDNLNANLRSDTISNGNDADDSCK